MTVEADPPGRWRELAVLAAGTLLGLAPWFSSAAVAPLLTDEWHATGLDLPLLTVAVQLGFAVGALALAATGAADVLPGRRLFCVGAFVAAACNLGFAFVATDPASALPWRVLTGVALAAVYPVGMRMIAGWFRLRSAALAIGVLDRRADHRVGAAAPVPGRRARWPASTGARSSRSHRSPRSSAASLVAGLRATGSVRDLVAALQRDRRGVGVPPPLGPAREPRLPRPHVGALRDVDLGAAVHRRELRGRRLRRSGRRVARGLRRGRHRRGRLRRGRRRSRTATAGRR